MLGGIYFIDNIVNVICFKCSCVPDFFAINSMNFLIGGDDA